MKQIPQSLRQIIARVQDTIPQQKIADMFSKCFLNTFETTLRPQSDRSVFVITGDIPAMWLRDSSAQVRPYLLAAEHDSYMADLLVGVSRKQVQCVLLDVYANAFNETASGQGYQSDVTPMQAGVWERKYEVDSLASVLELAYLIWQRTKRTDHLDQNFLQAAWQILNVWKLEQRHENSPYAFQRFDSPDSDTLPNAGRGSRVGFTGMTWSGFRPSDDACRYGYLIPSNMFASVTLGYLASMARAVWQNDVLATQAEQLALEIRAGIEQFGLVEHPNHGQIYAYEVDGLGQYHIMDDANVPSLLSAPYLGFCSAAEPIYQRTRAAILSSTNPYFFVGKAAQGIGSPHTPTDYIWHIALCMQGITSQDPDEQNMLLEMLATTNAGTGLMHEGFHKDNPNLYTRSWFAWANSLFAQFVMQQCQMF